MTSATTPTTNAPAIVNVAMRRLIPCRSSRVARGSSRWAMPATKSSSTSRNRTMATMIDANTAIQKATGRARLIGHASIKPAGTVSCAGA
jgi:hypothetical protein